MADKSSLNKVRSSLPRNRLDFEEAKIASVLCVVHDISHVQKFIERNDEIAGVEMEVSIFPHFSKKLQFTFYALLYVSDNQRYDVISGARLVRQARRKALRDITGTALEIL